MQFAKDRDFQLQSIGDPPSKTRADEEFPSNQDEDDGEQNDPPLVHQNVGCINQELGWSRNII